MSPLPTPAAFPATSLHMLSGFGNHHSSEAVKGALPIGQNSPQHVPYGLYAEQLSITAFTAPRADNRRSWLYRMRPSAAHPPFAPMIVSAAWAGLAEGAAMPSPNRLRWDAMPPLSLETAVDFIDGLHPICTNGQAIGQEGSVIFRYAANRSMQRRAFFSADGEWLIVPQQGRLRVQSEMGVMDIAPLQIAIIPRGMRFQVHVLDESAAGYACENQGAPFRLPELGPIGSNGLANVRDFEAPGAAFEDREEDFEIIQKFQNRLWHMAQSHSPFDVLAWHGNAAPYRYDLKRFNVINTVSFDHPDPSIFTLLTSPGDTAGTANMDFVIFPPRWMVAEHSFRPPWFHRNVMSEFMGLITGAYDAKASGFVPGAASVHNQMSAHGPDAQSYRAAVAAPLAPQKIEGTMAFMLESRLPFAATKAALESPQLQRDYDGCWADFPKASLPTPAQEDMI